MLIKKPTKVKTKNMLTYRNVHKSVVEMLRQTLNEELPAWDADTELQTAPPSNSTSSSSGSYLNTKGFCSKYGSCRVDKLEFQKQESCQGAPQGPNTVCDVGARLQRTVQGLCNTFGHCVAHNLVRWNHFQCI